MAEKKSNRLLKHSSIYAAGNILRQLVGFIMLPIYTNYLAPADYGAVGLITFAISIIEGLFGARLGEAMPKFYFEQKTDEARRAVISTAMTLTTLASVVVLMPMIITSIQSSQLLFGTTTFSTIVQLFSVLILTNAIESQALIYIRLQQKPWLFIGITLVKLVLQLSANIYFVVHQGMGVMGVAIGSILSALIISLALLVYSAVQAGFGFNKEIAKKMVKFSWPLWISGLASLYVFSANRYYIRIFSSLDDVGLFELAAKFAIILIVLIYRPFAQYWDAERFRIFGEPNCVDTYRKTFSIVCIALTAAALGLSIFSTPVIKLMTQPEFHRAGDVVPFLALAFFARCLTDFCNFSFFVAEKTGWINRNYYLTAAIVTVLYVSLIPQWGLIGAGIAAMLGEAAQFLIAYHFSKRLYDQRLNLLPLLPLLGIFTVTCLAANVANQFSGIVLEIAMRAIIFTIGLIALFFFLNAADRAMLLGVVLKRYREKQPS